MSFSTIHRNGAVQPLAEINMIPLIDVMLVLLVIFIVTAPLLTHAVKVDLPRVSSTPDSARPATVQIVIRETGEVFWNGVIVNRRELIDRLGAAALVMPQPELHLRADRHVSYGHVARVMGDAARSGLGRIAFVTETEVASPP